jgi:hypothetical protein
MDILPVFGRWRGWREWRGRFVCMGVALGVIAKGSSREARPEARARQGAMAHLRPPDEIHPASCQRTGAYVARTGQPKPHGSQDRMDENRACVDFYDEAIAQPGKVGTKSITDVMQHVGPDLVSGRELPVRLPIRVRPAVT